MKKIIQKINMRVKNRTAYILIYCIDDEGDYDHDTIGTN